MTLRIRSNVGAIDLQSFVFNGGEVQVKTNISHSAGVPLGVKSIEITAHLTSSDSIMELLLATDALRRQFGHDVLIHLIAPYLPYARQDRVCAPGEALSLRVMCDLINAQRYASVAICDAHSEAAPALLDCASNIPPRHFVSQIASMETVLVAPDAGAIKKVSDCARAIGAEMVRADKTRDVMTGVITGTVVYSGHIGEKDFLIVDDICDGGRTFIELAKVLRPLTSGKVLLYVTHGIFSQGLDPFQGLIDHIYVAYPFPNVDLSRSDLITQMT